MGALALLAHGLGGVVLANAVPHLVCGLQGRPFQSPFAKPPGVGLSSSTVNVAWGFANLVIAYLLVFGVGTFDLTSSGDALAFGVGFLLSGLGLARMFGRLHGGNHPGRP
ncbi:hypothetical protein [Methylobacterium brachythecii]|uniref:Uncharacterized protein n=1 Tax=Methylobacterium brachythecii TaxID=1176177 RepID=A0A7W6F637_9HYPH|nr:hypothetical protein [Methylobacterium brachythecii]MBB3901972.1 hypothetical protein [Methylobacterium brachythecii]GLS43354.1 hypothetical protein GCM10007884_13390 [Methylobacterium brachythecii]